MVDPGVGQKKLASLAQLMAKADLREADLSEQFIRAQGPGGQHVNTSATAVMLRHEPSGLQVKVQSARSQAINRYEARKRLAEKIINEREGKKSAEAQRVAKVIRQKRRRSRRAKAKMLHDKKHVGDKKRLRRPPDS